MRSVLLLGFLVGSAYAQKPAPLATLPADKLKALAPLLRSNELCLIESNDKGALKQLTAITLAQAPPEKVREAIAHPELYKDFVRNTKLDKVTKEPGGTLYHEYAISYGIYTVDGHHRYVFPPDGSIEIYDADANGVRHYRWELLPLEGGATVVVLYGYSQVPRDGFMKRFLDAAPAIEHGLALIPQLTLLVTMKKRAEELAHNAATLPPAGAAPYEFLLERGTLALFRTAGGRISDLSLVARTDARPEVAMQVAGDPTQWSQFVPIVKRSTPLGTKDGIAGVELEESLPLMSWTSSWAYRAQARAVDLFAIAGDLHGAQIRWDVRPLDGRSELVMRSKFRYEQGSLVVKELYKLEPLFEYGIDVALGLVLLDGVRSRAESISRSRVSR